jgi:formylglycine-generating enzyme required for sulfatase activity
MAERALTLARDGDIVAETIEAEGRMRFLLARVLTVAIVSDARSVEASDSELIYCRAAHAAFTGGRGSPDSCVATCAGLSEAHAKRLLAECARFAAPLSPGPQPRSAEPRLPASVGDRWLAVGVQPVFIAGGRYRPGSDGVTNDVKRPAYDVEVAPFEMSRTEVTVGQYTACVRDGGCPAQGETRPTSSCNWGKSDRDDYPINCLGWKEAKSFATWLGQGARLPTEAEWEWAARGREEGRTYPWGNTPAPDCTRVVMKLEEEATGGCGENRTWEVCSKSPSGDSRDGVCDLAGNVGEWLEDGYLGGHGRIPRDATARAVGRYGSISVRGGSFLTYSRSDFEVTRRSLHPHSIGMNSLGFRVVRSAR